MQLEQLFSFAAIEHDNHIFSRLWRAIGNVEFWHEVGERLVLLAVLILAARVILSITDREVRTLARHRIGGYRATTLIDMIQSFIRYVIVFVVILLGLQILGVPADHVLAGLGIGGLIMALGTQNLIRDLVSGIALLMEDTMSVGDQVIIQPNALRGEVAKMGARIVELKGTEGETHLIAYSSISSVTNLTARKRD